MAVFKEEQLMGEDLKSQLFLNPAHCRRDHSMGQPMLASPKEESGKGANSNLPDGDSSLPPRPSAMETTLHIPLPTQTCTEKMDEFGGISNQG